MGFIVTIVRNCFEKKDAAGRQNRFFRSAVYSRNQYTDKHFVKWGQMSGIIALLIGFPCFSSIIQSEGAQTLVYSTQTAFGYSLVGSLSSGWGGVPETVVYTTDQYGTVVSQTAASFSGEPVSSVKFQDGIAVICNSSEKTAVTLFSSAGVELWLTELTGEQLLNAEAAADGKYIVAAGNVCGFLQVTELDSTGNIVWSTNYPSITFSVGGVFLYDDVIFILGTSEEPNWHSSVRVLVLNSEGTVLELHTLFSGEGRMSSQAITVDDSGIYILVNATTEQNNMIGEVRLVKMNFLMEPQWAGVLSGTGRETATGMVSLADGGFAVSGWSNSIPFSESDRSDLSIGRFSSSGDLVWVRQYGGVSADYGLSVAAVSDGGLLVTGCSTEDLYQGWFLKTDSLGFLEPQGVQDYSSDEFSAVLLVNPVVSEFLPFVLNCPEPGVVKIVMYDTAGRSVAGYTTAVTSGENLFNMSVSVPSGVYSVLVSDAVNHSVFRAVVCRGGR